MTRCLLPVLCLAAATLGRAEEGPSAATLTGWFACDRCGPARLKREPLGPSNPECSRRCLEDGAAAVFLSEQGRELWKVKGYAAAKNDLGYRIELTGSIDPGSQTFAVRSVKRMEYTGSQCARPRKEA